MNDKLTSKQTDRSKKKQIKWRIHRAQIRAIMYNFLQNASRCILTRIIVSIDRAFTRHQHHPIVPCDICIRGYATY